MGTRPGLNGLGRAARPRRRNGSRGGHRVGGEAAAGDRPRGSRNVRELENTLEHRATLYRMLAKHNTVHLRTLMYLR
jgi:hypothetical protein